MASTLDDMIRNLQFYVQDRQIGLAEILGRHFEDRNDVTPFKQSGYVILSIASAYFEMIQQFIEGKQSEGQGWEFFKRGFKDVYPDPQWTDESIKKIYKVVRCGMYHGGMPKINCHLSRYFQPGFHLCRNEIHVNPAAVVREIRRHFEQYIDSLQNNPTRRVKFEKMCKIMGLDQMPPDQTYCDPPGGTQLVFTTPAPMAKGEEPIHFKVEIER